MYSDLIRYPHQSAPLHQVSPSECPFTSGIPIRVPLYIRYPHQSIPIRVPLYIRYPHQSAPLHQLSPSECPLHQLSPSECPLHQLSPSEC
ncbi:unnamed protein product, partial [Staurois parvus]